MSKWKKTTLGEIATIITGPFGSQLHQSDYVSSGIAIVMPQNIADRKIDYGTINYISEQDAERLKKYRTQKSDILYARRGNIEKHAFITESDKGVYCGTGCLRVRVSSRDILPMFVSYFLNREETKKWIVAHAVGTNMPNLNTDILSEVPINYPSIEIQQKVVSVLYEIDEKININNKINDNLQQMAYDTYMHLFFPI